MRLWVHPDQKVVQPPGDRILARRQLMQLGVFEHVVALAHGALYIHHAVTHQATQPRLCLRAVHDLTDGRVEHPAEEQGGIVAPGAPF